MNPKLYNALRWGAICGGIVGLLETASYWGALRLPLDQLLAKPALDLTWFDWLGMIQLVLEWLAALIAGALVGREVEDRNIALVGGLICGVVIALISIFYQAVAPPPLELISGVDGSVDPVGGIIAATFSTVTLGAAGGWLGGWLATRTHTPPM